MILAGPITSPPGVNIFGVIRSSGNREKRSLCFRHLVQQVLSYRLLLHLHRDAVGGIVALHIDELSLIGGHAHHPLLPVQDKAEGGRSLVRLILKTKD